MADPPPHISVCICTYKRPEILRRALNSIEAQSVEGLFTYSVVVADNDGAQSAREIVTSFASTSTVPVTYCSEPRQNIALARNKAVAAANGDWIAFIDDDEFAEPSWLRNMLNACVAYGADGVLGPVVPHFDITPPDWILKGKFFERPAHATGYRLDWSETRTGNVLFRHQILDPLGTPFSPDFDTAGEDVDFFRRLIEQGRLFIWCAEAIVYESVPSCRCTRSYLLRRALLRGSNFRKHPRNRVKNATKSLIAVPCYLIALPVLALFGHHVFIEYLSKLLDHSSRLLSFIGVMLRTQRET